MFEQQIMALKDQLATKEKDVSDLLQQIKLEKVDIAKINRAIKTLEGLDNNESTDISA